MTDVRQTSNLPPTSLGQGTASSRPGESDRSGRMEWRSDRRGAVTPWVHQLQWTVAAIRRRIARALWSGRASSVLGEMWRPRMDVFERDGVLVVDADVPGVRQDDLHVHVDGSTLTLSGLRRHAHEHEDGGVQRCERSYGRFRRSVRLPEGIKPEAVRATFDNGVLEVTVPLDGANAGSGRDVSIVAGKRADMSH